MHCGHSEWRLNSAEVAGRHSAHPRASQAESNTATHIPHEQFAVATSVRPERGPPPARPKTIIAPTTHTPTLALLHEPCEHARAHADLLRTCANQFGHTCYSNRTGTEKCSAHVRRIAAIFVGFARRSRTTTKLRTQKPKSRSSACLLSREANVSLQLEALSYPFWRRCHACAMRKARPSETVAS